MNENTDQRKFGVHLTPSDISDRYIIPEIKDDLWKHTWVDLYCGEGNLILPIVKRIPKPKRNDFFKEHILLRDIQQSMVDKCIEKTVQLGIKEDVARDRIKVRNGLASPFTNHQPHPVYHITNPPYLYIGYIKKKKEMRDHLKYFSGNYKKLQDLYQVAMMNDVRAEMEKMIYIIPSNFLYGNSVSNKIRNEFFKYYRIEHCVLFEIPIFEETGIGVGIFYFSKNTLSKHSPVKFTATKIQPNEESTEVEYELKPKHDYRAGSEFDEFVETHKARDPLKVEFYLQSRDLSRGRNEISVIDSSKYDGTQYEKKTIKVSDDWKNTIKSNILYIRTIDTGSWDGRIGLEVIKDDFGVDGIYVSGKTARTQPIQLFLDPMISSEKQYVLANYFNLMIEHWRKELNGDFLTNYKYSDSIYTRKYMGLIQVKDLIGTFPINTMDDSDLKEMKEAISEYDIERIIQLIKSHSGHRKKKTINQWFK